MSNVRFIADLHFGHEGMAKKRGFDSVDSHDNYIIDKWNSVCNKKDTVYILGDITMETSKHYYKLDKLKGRKIVVLGNHDMRKDIKDLLNYVDQVVGMKKHNLKEKGKAFLTHCPIHPMELDYRVKYNIHGHIHENLVMIKNNGVEEIDSRYICVSCENVDYTPKLLSELF